MIELHKRDNINEVIALEDLRKQGVLTSEALQSLMCSTQKG